MCTLVYYVHFPSFCATVDNLKVELLRASNVQRDNSYSHNKANKMH